MITWTVLIYLADNDVSSYVGPSYEVAGNITLRVPPRVGDELRLPGIEPFVVLWVTEYNHQIGTRWASA